MHAFIVFRLYGPLEAWGDIAVGEERPTTSHPSKSAVLGLVAAALGLRRDQEPEHQALRDGYSFGVRVDALGVPLRDYHTSQSPKSSSRLAHLRSRRDELADPHNRTTALSTRDYRCDGFYTACLCRREHEQAPTPEDILDALTTPRFTLYLGRKSCPAALPLSPHLIQADHLVAALDAFDEAEAKDQRGEFVKEFLSTALRGNPQYYWEDDLPAGIQPLHSTPRYDQPLSRTRRQFAPRTEHYASSKEA